MAIKNDVESGTMSLRGVFGDYFEGVMAEDFHDALAEHNGDEITIMLESPGGVVSEGLSIYNSLMNYPGKVTIHVDTMAASIASVIACAADNLIMNSNAQLMIHNAWTVAMGNASDLKGIVEQLEMLDGMIADIYVERTGASKEELKAMMDKETYLPAEDAVALGFADSIHKVERKRKDEKAKAFAIAPCVIAAKAKAASLKMRLSM